MVNPKRLLQLARKWQRMALTNRHPITSSSTCTDEYNSAIVVPGHFVVYKSDKKRFVIPLEYLNENVFKELLKLSEEEFGLQTDRPIKLPCDSNMFEYIILLIKKQVPQHLEKALLTTLLTSYHHSTLSSSTTSSHQQSLVYF